MRNTEILLGVPKGMSNERFYLSLPSGIYGTAVLPKLGGSSDDFFSSFTAKGELLSIKTTNMDTLCKLAYDMLHADGDQRKSLLMLYDAEMEIIKIP